MTLKFLDADYVPPSPPTSQLVEYRFQVTVGDDNADLVASHLWCECDPASGLLTGARQGRRQPRRSGPLLALGEQDRRRQGSRGRSAHSSLPKHAITVLNSHKPRQAGTRKGQHPPRQRHTPPRRRHRPPRRGDPRRRRHGQRHRHVAPHRGSRSSPSTTWTPPAPTGATSKKARADSPGSLSPKARLMCHPCRDSRHGGAKGIRTP